MSKTHIFISRMLESSTNPVEKERLSNKVIEEYKAGSENYDSTLLKTACDNVGVDINQVEADKQAAAKAKADAEAKAKAAAEAERLRRQKEKEEEDARNKKNKTAEEIRKQILERQKAYKEARKAEEAKKAEEARKAEEAKKQQEEADKKAAEEAKKAEEDRKYTVKDNPELALKFEIERQTIAAKQKLSASSQPNEELIKDLADLVQHHQKLANWILLLSNKPNLEDILLLEQPIRTILKYNKCELLQNDYLSKANVSFKYLNKNNFLDKKFNSNKLKNFQGMDTFIREMKAKCTAAEINLKDLNNNGFGQKSVKVNTTPEEVDFFFNNMVLPIRNCNPRSLDTKFKIENKEKVNFECYNKLSTKEYPQATDLTGLRAEIYARMQKAEANPNANYTVDEKQFFIDNVRTPYCNDAAHQSEYFCTKSFMEDFSFMMDYLNADHSI